MGWDETAKQIAVSVLGTEQGAAGDMANSSPIPICY